MGEVTLVQLFLPRPCDVQATRGEDGRPKHVNEIGSIHMAVQLAM